MCDKDGNTQGGTKSKMTTARETWKALERRICAKLGGRRTPLSGSNSQHGTSADCIETKYPKLYIEIKLRAKFLHHSIFKEVVKMARLEDKTPILVTHVKNEESELVILKVDDFVAIIEDGQIKEVK